MNRIIIRVGSGVDLVGGGGAGIWLRPVVILLNNL
jgi:hypothetical protein